MGHFFGLVLACFAFASCSKPFDVNVATPEPVKVDVAMDVHVYQHGSADSKEKEEALQSYKEVMSRRRDRMAEIQELKNSRLVGESHRGTLEIRTLPAGEYGDYVKKTVGEENEDREFLIAHEAKEKGTSPGEIREAQWRHWQRKSFPGEWIEVEKQGKEGEYQWVQKAAAEEGEGEEVPGDE